MQKNWYYFLNLCIAGLAIFVLLIAGVVALFRPSTIEIPAIQEKSRPPPQNGFLQDRKSYDAIGTSLFVLKFAPPKMQLPDLKRFLTYYGANGRPDARKATTVVYFGLANTTAQGAVSQGEKLYLLYDRTQKPPRYVFSPDNKETALWLEVTPQEKSAEVSVFMKNERGEIIRDPPENGKFTLEQKEFARLNRPDNWEIGKLRVDGTLLARQRARWLGQDKFLLDHGGEEFSNLGKKQRIDFGEGDDAYTVYLGEGDVLVWDRNRWQAVEPGDQSVGKPLIVISKIADRLLTLDLWTPDGSNKVVLNLLKGTDKWSQQQIKQSFKYIAARTRSQYIFEIDKHRITLSPQDWIVKTEKGWEKLDTVQKIDDFVESKITGPLFIFDAVVNKDQKQILTGTLYSPARTEAEAVELELPPSNVTVITLPKSGEPPAEPKLTPEQP